MQRLHLHPGAARTRAVLGACPPSRADALLAADGGRIAEQATLLDGLTEGQREEVTRCVRRHGQMIEALRELLAVSVLPA